LRKAGVLGFGPRVSGALPLDQLAGADRQPLARLLAAWLPTGWLAGRALAAATGLGRPARAIGVGLVAFALLFVAGAISDAATISDSVGSHVSAQFGRTGTWVAAGLMLLGAWAAPPPRAAAASAAPSER
jgi:hypothetical protein